MAGGLLLFGTILNIAERLIWGGGYFRMDLWSDVPLAVISLVGLGAAVVLLIGLRAPAIPALGAGAAGMLFTSAFTQAVFVGRYLGMGYAQFVIVLLATIISLAALVLAILSAKGSGPQAPAQAPAQWAGPPAAPQWAPPQPAPQWGHGGQPAPPQYQQPQ
ncbi:hypothetical protein AB0H76_33705 [Nocardia sp. NPDC050712]|uniref:hypothetical protein n=1 Tax=Nocardia sp. NPDC050712 TaxID=3155518 RepID=UPI0033F1CC8F